jgi:hypothetical protein
VLELNGCSTEAYPSNQLDAYRALDNPKFILLDESDFFRKSEQEDVRHVSERYIAKSDPFIVMVSTPYAPEVVFLLCILSFLTPRYSYFFFPDSNASSIGFVSTDHVIRED